jgi:uncharacterized protein YaaR (DUF327 family)
MIGGHYTGNSMSMTLTKDDLAAIEHLIDTSLETKLEAKLDAKLQPRFDAFEGNIMKIIKKIDEKIDDLDDKLSRQTATGFADVYIKIEDLQRTVNRIERTQRVTLKGRRAIN